MPFELRTNVVEKANDTEGQAFVVVHQLGELSNDQSKVSFVGGGPAEIA